jgi:hypothetical protein
MKYSDFSDVVEILQKQSDLVSELYLKKVDLLEFADPYDGIIRILLTEIYTAEGYDWFTWFCYENDFGKGTLDAHDETGPICYDVKSLWEFLEKTYTRNDLT